ncbi:MAG TPA: methyltransferase domain-containing protein [Pyrinomonadaceae bacterium]|nr:methyltransferase domain-containing protein [Pyrinomonadaceae bacterium]
MKLLEVLACPTCGGELKCTATETDSTGEVVSGRLDCRREAHHFPIEDSIPRFVPRENYAASFGYQWNKFKLEQIDSINGKTLSTDRFYSETGWTKSWLAGKWILDAGCGAGRFLDVAAASEANIVGVDLSSAIDAARSNLQGRKNIHFVQASIYELPFREGAFDGCYCIGVVQHTPDPRRTIRTLPRLLRAGGRLAITAYVRKPWTKLNAKYLVRPLTKRLKKQTLLAGIKRTMPVLFPLTNALFRLPLAGRFFMFTIPVANYVHEPQLTSKQRYDWAILDTFDMLSPEYDQPPSPREMVDELTSAGVINLRRLDNPGLNIIGEKAPVENLHAGNTN